MKNPKITEGEWFPIQYGGYWIIQDENHYGGLNVFDEQHFPLAKNNAKAASATPEMIDALMGVMHSIEECRLDNGGVALGDVLEENVKSALIKAGVFDD